MKIWKKRETESRKTGTQKQDAELLRRFIQMKVEGKLQKSEERFWNRKDLLFFLVHNQSIYANSANPKQSLTNSPGKWTINIFPTSRFSVLVTGVFRLTSFVVMSKLTSVIALVLVLCVFNIYAFETWLNMKNGTFHVTTFVSPLSRKHPTPQCLMVTKYTTSPPSTMDATSR